MCSSREAQQGMVALVDGLQSSNRREERQSRERGRYSSNINSRGAMLYWLLCAVCRKAYQEFPVP